MMVCSRMSTFSCSATAAALRSGRTLNPIMIAFTRGEQHVRFVDAPTPERIREP